MKVLNTGNTHLSNFDKAGLENEHNDTGGHTVYGATEGFAFYPATEARMTGCPECGDAYKARKAAVTEGKKGVCRTPLGDHELAEAVQNCTNCGAEVLHSLVRKSGWSHRHSFIG